MPIKPLVTAGIENVLNAFLYRAPALKTARQRLNGKVLRIVLKEFSTPLVLVFSERQLDVLGEWEGEADCSVITHMSVLPKLRNRQQMTALIRSGELEVEGDIQVVQNFVALSDQAEFDPAELLAPYIGDIAAAIGLKDVTTGDTLCDPDHPIILERMEFPEPVISIAVEPKTKADQEKMGLALGRLAKEDPSFRVWTDEESNQTIIAGMGELHLDIIVDRMKREFNVEANVGKPQVAYREAIRAKVTDVEGKHAKQSGGRGQYGHVVIDMYPLEPGSNPKGYEFINDIKGGVIPGEYIPAVDKGIQEQLKAGPLAGYPVVDMGVRLHFGSYHDVDSSELAFKLAASIAFKEGFKKAKPVLLEPIMKVEVETPEENTGDVIGDLSRRRGMLRGQESEVTGVKIHAEVPLSEMFGYATQLRSLTKGRASYTMEFLKYDDAPNNVAQAVIEARGK